MHGYMHALLTYFCINSSAPLTLLSASMFYGPSDLRRGWRTVTKRNGIFKPFEAALSEKTKIQTRLAVPKVSGK